MNLKEVENKISDQKVKFIKGISNLKAKEDGEKQTCQCQGFCHISHQKHNWRTSSFEDILDRLKSLELDLKVLCLIQRQKHEYNLDHI